jgi:hypothetical protein
MSTNNYPDCVRELYESEIFGEAIALALVKVARSERDAYHLGTLLQLETETKARLRPFLSKHGISLDEDMEISGIEDMVTAYENTTWQAFVGGLIPVVETFLDRFREIMELGREEDQEMLDSMVQHEAAILKWLQDEQAGPSASSLDAMVAQLNYPLPER